MNASTRSRLTHGYVSTTALRTSGLMSIASRSVGAGLRLASLTAYIARASSSGTVRWKSSAVAPASGGRARPPPVACSTSTANSELPRQLSEVGPGATLYVVDNGLVIQHRYSQCLGLKLIVRVCGRRPCPSRPPPGSSSRLRGRAGALSRRLSRRRLPRALCGR